MILEPFDEMKYQPESMTEKNYHDTEEVIIRNLREILPFDYGMYKLCLYYINKGISIYFMKH